MLPARTSFGSGSEVSQKMPKRMVLGRAVSRWSLAIGLIAGLTSPAAAQGTIRGRVVDSETGTPIAEATVNFRNGAMTLTTDSAGRFEARNLAGGDARVLIQKLGFLPGDYRIRVPESGETDKVFSLDFTGQKMAPIAIQARAELVMARYTDFEARRQRGIGTFLRWDQLTNEKFGSVGDALRSVRGVRIQCKQQETGECFAVMARSQNCRPVWIIDGTEASHFNENTPIRDVYGIEVYRGAGEVPGEYAGSNAACGVIIMWTKSRPYRSTSP
jgi:hypothetical protein